jgi:hypothetical protein
MVYPNVRSLLGTWSDRYESDFDFLTSTVEKYTAIGFAPIWYPNVIGVARPRQEPYAETVSAL